MNARVHRRPARDHSIIEIEPAFRDQICRLGVEAQRHLLDRINRFWARPDGPELLAQLLAGALILRRVGRKTKDDVVLEDKCAHLAFAACCTLALAVERLGPEVHAILQETVTLLAACCPVAVTVGDLPLFETLPARYQTNNHVRQLYYNFSVESEEPPEVTLYSALILLRLFQRAGRPQDAALVLELLEVTTNLRTVIKRLGKPVNR